MAENPFAAPAEYRDAATTGLVSVEQQRAIAEVQARMIIARANPRDAVRSADMILQDCTRTTLAETALYQYARGGTDITGPSIRLMETIARRWGNIASGIKEVDRRDGYSECIAYAWDLETGYYDERQFRVRHWRDTKGGGRRVTDERDIYELTANFGQRRKRAVLMAVIPGDVVEAAVQQCEETLKAQADTSAEALHKMVESFVRFDITKEMIEARIQRRLEAIRPAQVVQLRKIWSSLNDGMSAAADWFELVPQQTSAPQTGNEALRSRLRRDAPAQPAPHPAHDAPDRSPEVQLESPPTASPGSAPPDPGEKGDSGERSRRDAVSSPATPFGGVSSAEEEDPMKVVKPVRLRRGSGWDWPKYADEIIHAARRLRADQVQEFANKNEQMLHVLRASDAAEWSRVEEALAEHEHSAAGEE